MSKHVFGPGWATDSIGRAVWVGTDSAMVGLTAPARDDPGDEPNAERPETLAEIDRLAELAAELGL